MNTKSCTNCDKLKCNCAYKKKYREENKDKIRAYNQKYYKQNIESEKERTKKYIAEHKEYYLEYNKQYYKDNRETINARKNKNDKKRSKKDINFKLARYLRSRLSSAIRLGQKQGSAVRNLGCSLDEFKRHLEKQFDNDMNWDNYGKYGWHIDHIIPLCSFDLSKKEELIKACHYTNLRPLWFSENLSKANEDKKMKFKPETK
jgi:hypothetical protein